MSGIDVTCIDAAGTGGRIKQYMIREGLTVKQIQSVCGCSHQSVYRWVNGLSVPTIDHLVILAGLFRVPLDDIVVTKRTR